MVVLLFMIILSMGNRGSAREETVHVVGETRSQSVRLVLPNTYQDAAEDAQPVPLVVMLHGLNGSGDGYARLYRLDTVRKI